MNTSGVKKESKNLKFTNTEKQQLKQHNDTVSPLKQIKYLQVKTNYLFQLINQWKEGREEGGRKGRGGEKMKEKDKERKGNKGRTG